ncbi:IS256 family transposase [Tautonia plasticadhaerens]|uniref:Mutator family transposase n=1 Tax=Tautonia plasticadhaerens TaxID=2527974 RepID=A0A518H9U3_9BACT|nr:transposase [Tautonia plasticadhaerens]QDV37621.1 Transposase, Mutator family [Tautonia plasticadhaerens]
MTHQDQPAAIDEVMELLAEHGSDGLAQAIGVLRDELMERERTQALGAAPHRRSEARKGSANGSKPQTRHTPMGPIAVRVPQARGLDSYASALERGVRSERASKPAVAERDGPGVSTGKGAAIAERPRGSEVTGSQVSRAAGALDEGPEGWRGRPPGETPYPIPDARDEEVRLGGSIASCAVLTAIGIDPEGRRSIPGVGVSMAEAEVHWRGFPASLQARGPHGVEMPTGDAHAGREQALAARLTGVPRRRGQSPPAEDAPAYVPRPSLPPEVAAGPRAVFDAPDRGEAERRLGLAAKRCRAVAPKPAEWPEQDVPEGLTILTLPPGRRRRLRTSDMPERLNEEVSRRTQVAGLSPNEGSVLRLVSAVAMGISEGWETGRRRMAMGPG